METYKLFEAEFRLMTLIWEREPISSPELTKLCEGQFGWKKSTTYTQIKRLSERGFLENKNTIVSSLVKKEQVERYESESVVNDRFEGSLPRFLTAFLDSKPLSEKELNELREIIDRYKEG